MKAATSAGSESPLPARSRPRATTVFAAAFVAGAAVAVGVNSVLDVHLRQARPQVECEPIFVALRSMPQGSPVTVWDVALRDWPKAMLPTTALRADDSFEGLVLRHPIREGQPLLAIQLVREAAMQQPAAGSTTPLEPAFVSPTAAAAGRGTTPDADLWSPAEPIPAVPSPAAPSPTATASAPISAPTEPVIAAPTPMPPPDTAASSTPAPAAATEGVPMPQENLAASSPQPISTEAVPPVTPPVDARQPVAAVSPAPASMPQSEPAGDPLAQTETVVVPVPLTTIADLPPEPAATVEEAPLAPAAPEIDAPVTLADEPTLADDFGGEQPADAEPEVRSVIAPSPFAVSPPDASASVPQAQTVIPEATTVPTAPMPLQPPPQRYLVVPERIALQADTSFVSPRPLPSAAVEPSQARPAPATPAETRPAGPARSASARQTRPTPSTPSKPQDAGTARTRQPSVRPTQPATTRPSQKSPQMPATRKPTAERGRGLGGMFSGITAGIEALTGGRRRTADDRTAIDEALATDETTSPPTR